jgi:3-hydroxybutyryl-CoA dehydratase
MALYTVKQFDDLAVGERVAISKTITEADGALYIAATGDFGPVHIDDGYAAGTRFKRRLAPGIMVAGLATSVLTSHLVGILGVSIEDQFWFTGPVFYGDTVTFEVWISGKDPDKRVLHWEGSARTQNGAEVLKARATLKFPRAMSKPA